MRTVERAKSKAPFRWSGKSFLGQDGSVAIQTAVLLTAMLGFVALGVEVSQLLLQQRQQQAATDNAAMAAAIALATSDPVSEAQAVTAELGLKNGVNGVGVSVGNPPTSGSHSGDGNYVQVAVQQTTSPVLSGLFHSGGFTIKTQAVAVRSLGVNACILALDSSSASAVSIGQNSVVTVSDCGIAVNSTSNSGLNLSNNSTLDGAAAVGGDVSISNGAKITGGTTKHAVAATNPYASVTLPSKPSASSTASSNPGTLSPGWYPNGWSFANNAVVNLQSGVYWIGTQLSFGNKATISGSGVTLIIDGSYAIDSGNTAVVNLSAPTSGPTSGIAIYSSSGNSSSVTQSFGNNSALNITGALYFPSQTVQIDNNVMTGGASCTQLVARIVTIKNNANVTLKDSCSGTGVSPLSSKTNASLVQ